MLEGWIDDFIRPTRVEQPGMAVVAEALGTGDLRGHNALVVGGSRGLGEVTAKIVSAGGGYPLITYREALDDAERVATEIRDVGALCETLHLHVIGFDEVALVVAVRAHGAIHLY